MREFFRRALLSLATYLALPLPVIVAGFLGAKFGIWAAILWGVILLTGLAAYMSRRSRSE